MKLKILLLSFLAVFLMAGSAMAGPFGDEITIYDNRSGTYNGSNGGGWWTNQNEDQEVEPGMIHNQDWDLEGFFLDGTTLTMVGGWDFVNGVVGYSFTSGDIFIDVDGNAQYGAGADPSVTNRGYDYVFDVNWGVNNNIGSYNVYALDGGSTLHDVYYYNSPESSPWSFDWTDEGLLSSGSFLYSPGLSDSQTGSSGGTHYSVTGFDLSFLAPGTEFISHFTMECGNDNLMGSGTTPVPEPATMFLLGSGLIGLAVVGRRKFFKKS